jgi:hemoglobin-like flavoprotein
VESLLSRNECRLVQASFAQIEPMADRVAATFYRHLFELEPDLRLLFKIDMEKQGVKFMEKLAVAVAGLEDLGSIEALVRALGRRHAEYGVATRDYETVREALLWALGDALGPSFDNGLRDAWAAAFSTLSKELIRAAEGYTGA